jgi:hypothetical protein
LIIFDELKCRNQPSQLCRNPEASSPNFGPIFNKFFYIPCVFFQQHLRYIIWIQNHNLQATIFPYFHHKEKQIF